MTPIADRKPAQVASGVCAQTGGTSVARTPRRETSLTCRDLRAAGRAVRVCWQQRRLGRSIALRQRQHLGRGGHRLRPGRGRQQWLRRRTGGHRRDAAARDGAGELVRGPGRDRPFHLGREPDQRPRRVHQRRVVRSAHHRGGQRADVYRPDPVQRRRGDRAQRPFRRRDRAARDRDRPRQPDGPRRRARRQRPRRLERRGLGDRLDRRPSHQERG